MPTNPDLWITADGRALRIADMATQHIRNAKAYLERGDKMRFEDAFRREDYIRVFKRELKRRTTMGTMTVAEAREFFRLWPMWMYRHKDTIPVTHKVVAVDDKGVSIDNYGTWNGVDDFLATHELCVSAHAVPVGSCWFLHDNRPMEVTKTGGSTVTAQTLSGEVTKFCTNAARFAQMYKRITPENFPWGTTKTTALTLCVVCDSSLGNLTHSRCAAMLLAVFGSTSRWRVAYEKWKVSGCDPALRGEKLAPKCNLPLGGGRCHLGMAHFGSCEVPAYPQELIKSLTAADLNKIESMFGALDKAADRALRHLCGLNLQDHSVKEQREHLEVVRELMAALRPSAK